MRLVNILILNYIYVSGINPALLRCSIILMHFHILFAKRLLSIFDICVIMQALLF